MKNKAEVFGLIFGGLSIVLFWVPPFGLFLGLTGLIISVAQFTSQLRFRKTAVVLSAVGISLFIAFWGTVWILSQ
jgi:hypothetical protein